MTEAKTTDQKRVVPYIQFRAESDGFLYARVAIWGVDQTAYPPVEIGRISTNICRSDELYLAWRNFARSVFDRIATESGWGPVGEWKEMPPPRGNA